MGVLPTIHRANYVRLLSRIHFVASFPAIRECRAVLLGEAPPSVKEALPDPACDSDHFFNIITGVEWLSDTDAQL